MTSVGIFFGSTDGATARIAQLMKEKLDALLVAGDEQCVELFDIAESDLTPMVRFDRLILGVPTWNTGQLQRDWEKALDESANLDLSGKCAAIFGLGDQQGYPATFVDAMVFVADFVRSAGARLVGAWPIAGYTFTNSWAIEDNRFLGLVLDEHSQPDLTETRIDQWLRQLQLEFDESP